jgi:hypothetical protein
LQEEHVLCTIKAYQDGSIDMTPGFSPRAPLKVDTMNNNQYSLAQRGVPYRVVTVIAAISLSILLRPALARMEMVGFYSI